MSSAIAIAFEELFYGSGAWLGLLLFISIIIALSLRSKFGGVLVLPVCVFLGINYLSYPTLMWHAVIMFFASVFVMINLFKGRGE